MKKTLIIGILFLSACSSRHATVNTEPGTPMIVHGKTFATFFQQHAAEYKALCYQAFNIARIRLDQYQPVSNLPKAIITDIDETVLDNSAYEAHQTLQGKDYDAASWLEWTNKAAADTVPGAPAFLKYAASKGVEIFYITNREEKERASTLQNLRQFGLPNADDAHFFPKVSGSGKEPRRQTVMATHEVIFLMGDNLGDFSSLFDKKTMDQRETNTDISMSDFGKKFIVLPNPVYGDWEGALINYNYKLTAAQKDSIIRSVLKSY